MGGATLAAAATSFFLTLMNVIASFHVFVSCVIRHNCKVKKVPPTAIKQNSTTKKIAAFAKNIHKSITYGSINLPFDPVHLLQDFLQFLDIHKT